MKKQLKRKIAMCLLAASLFNKSQNSNAVVRNIQNNCQNKQVDMSQIVKTGKVAGVVAGLLGLVIVIPLIVINSKADEKEVEKNMLQKNKDKLRNLFNEQAEKCKIENIQKYWNALNKIAQEDWYGIFKKAIDRRLGKNPENVKFDNITYFAKNFSFYIYLAGIDDYIDGKVTSCPPITNEYFKERNWFKSILNNKEIFSIFSFVGQNFRSLKKIMNGEFFLNSLEIKETQNGVSFKFKYLNEFELKVCIYRKKYLNIKYTSRNYGDFIIIEQKHIDNRLVLEFADSEQDFDLKF